MSPRRGIRRGFAWVGSRRLHFREAGAGPPVVLLHASPVSSTSLMEQVEYFAARGAHAIALDTPGYGESDRLTEPTPTLRHYAEALNDALQALGIERAVLYGRHTGAAIAVACAAAFRDRAAMVYCDGFPVYDDSTRARYLHRYVIHREPDWTGSHLIWAWNRYREQFVYWPWFEQEPGHRADTDVPPLSTLHQGTLDMLAAGSGYGAAERAVFGGDAASLLEQLSAPVVIAARRGDSLYRRVPLLAGYGSSARILEVPREGGPRLDAEWMAIAPALQGLSAALRPIAAARVGTVDRRFEVIGDVEWCVRSVHTLGHGSPMLLLPDAPGSSATLEALALSLAKRGDVYALDWPGHGNSSVDPPYESMFEYVDALEAWLRQRKLASFDLYAEGFGCTVAALLAAAQPSSVRSLSRIGALVIGDATKVDQLLPDLAPVQEGAHLLRAWQFARDRMLWDPWFDRRRASALMGPHDIDINGLGACVYEMLKQPTASRRLQQTLAQCSSEPLFPSDCPRLELPWPAERRSADLAERVNAFVGAVGACT